MKVQTKPVAFALAAFLAAWQATNFDLDYRSILGAATCAVLGFISPKKK